LTDFAGPFSEIHGRKGPVTGFSRPPWPGDPRVKIQRGKNGMAKPYQVQQVLKAIDRLAKESDENG